MTSVKDLGIDDAIEAAKKNGCRVRKATIDKEVYVYRSLTRQEWKKLQREAYKAAEDDEGLISQVKAMEYREESEDNLVRLATLYPSTDNILGWPAGISSKLVDLVTKLSGFEEVEIEIEEL